MFTGIIEDTGKIEHIRKINTNLEFEISTKLVPELKVDQSIAHNGVCLTVTDIDSDKGTYKVTVINETLKKTNLGYLKRGDEINFERCMPLNGRLDGHIVNGHVDQCGMVDKMEDQDGSWLCQVSFNNKANNIVVEKGTICMNGVSLTVVDAEPASFSVAIIPYTFENTNFRHLSRGQAVNLEFDIIGKYIEKLFTQHYMQQSR